MNMHRTELRSFALEVLGNTQFEKLSLLHKGRPDYVDCMATYTPTLPLPGNIPHVIFVDPKDVPLRGVSKGKNNASLIHALAHIEWNAINLALDIVWRFATMPEEFYWDWYSVALEECFHFSLLQKQLEKWGYTYGDFTVHNGLWEMAEKTQNNLLHRLAFVPRVLEARGLDAAARIQEKFANQKENELADILQIIVNDEEKHVSIGSKWFGYVAKQQKYEPEELFCTLLEQNPHLRPKPPLNIEARKRAGFTTTELNYLLGVSC